MKKQPTTEQERIYMEYLASKPTLADCLCGCNGDYTEHSMRAGESGRDSSVIIR